MRKNKKLILGLTTAFVSCAAILPINTFAKDYKVVNTTTVAATTDAKYIKTNVIGENSSEKGFRFMARTTFAADSYEDLVKEGIVSQETADNMKAYLDKEEEAMKAEMDKIQNMTEDELKAYFESMDKGTRTHDTYEKMVEEKIITAEEKEKIQDYYKAQMEQMMKDEIKASTDRYISEGILDKTTADKVADFLFEERSSMDHTMAEAHIVNEEDGVSITKAGRVRADSVSLRMADDNGERNVMINIESADGETVERGTHAAISIRVSGYESLTKAGIITETQQKAMEESDMKFAEKQRKESTDAILAGLVKDGTLTQTKADKISEFLDKLANGEYTQKESETVTVEGDDKFYATRAFNIFETLVEEGILTQEEADAVQEVLHGGMMHTVMAVKEA